ncbi:hypothetical protein TVAG_047230 [Trichomonas vaginalis G3]|uniref:Uncharacterized protein n=1 Tax=Trichomonas vaginalis (strain ATCC PRA-98 / G3) TaxID=412133 RepID=A2FHJ0_TRIV3|nr:hypothetical protein TVAGG3_0954350 [Trichomonas vaginalis G3]EAX95625.1 hypothetical protein TVAG_047230 [Trichomonas vaginalis G3]KAI5487442.1 hypothetical protein TVAGG3_0954350 [Trichomonas vaginalis G3]|eukprot:XP_001308555.1 hypothetical protein [Trichomonas vaginalis G3]
MTLSPEESQKILTQKLEMLKDKKNDRNMQFLQNLSISLETSPKIDDPNYDRGREAAFQKATIEGVYKAKEIMDELNIQYIRQEKPAQPQEEKKAEQ